MNVGIVSNGSLSTNSSNNATNSTNKAANNRTTFFEMLLGASNSSENSVELLSGVPTSNVAELKSKGISADAFSQLLATLQNVKDGSSVSEERANFIEEDIEGTLLNGNSLLDLFNSEEVELELMNLSNNEESDAAIIDQIINELLPEYLRIEVEELLNSPQSLQLDENYSSLAQMLAVMITIVNSKERERSAFSQTSFDQLKNQLQQALKAEAQVTGINADEIINKLEKLLTSGNDPKQDYLQGLLQRIPLPSNKQTEQSGLNMASVTDSAQTMSRAQQLVIHIGEQPTKEAEQREFLRQFQNILGKGLLKQLSNGSTQLTIRLHPQHLGKLDIQLVQLNGVITAKITATTKAAKEMIEGQLQQLRNTFVQQQINVDKVEVHQQQQQDQFTKNGQGRQHEQQEQRDNDKNAEERLEETFADFLDQLTINEKV